MLVSLVACATGEPSDPCRAAAEHVEECTGQTAPAAMPGTCDVDKAEDVLATDCNQLDPSKGDGLWSSFLCALGFTSYCAGGGGTQTMRTLTGNVHKVSDNSGAAGVYVRAIREDTGETSGSWTFTNGLFSIGDLQPVRYRIEVAFAPDAAALAHQTIDVGVQSYVLVLAPVP